MRRIWDERGLQQGFTLNFQQSSNKCLVVEKMLVFQFSDPCHICSLTYMLEICPDIWKCIRLCPCNCPSTSVHLIFMRDCNTCFACGVTNQILPSTNSKLKNSLDLQPADIEIWNSVCQAVWLWNMFEKGLSYYTEAVIDLLCLFARYSKVVSVFSWQKKWKVADQRKQTNDMQQEQFAKFCSSWLQQSEWTLGDGSNG